jgi:Cu/Ag efflux protein CusF
MKCSGTTRLWAVGLLLLAGGFAACDSQPTGTRDETPPPASYQLRGIVRQVDLGSIGRTQLSIHHEAIPDFVGLTGEVEGMKAMTMPFTAAESVDLTGVEPGSKISFELTVDWSAPEPALITKLQVLPPDTQLVFDQ